MLPGWLGFVGCGERLLEIVVRDVVVIIILDQRCPELLAKAVAPIVSRLYIGQARGTYCIIRASPMVGRRLRGYVDE